MLRSVSTLFIALSTLLLLSACASVTKQVQIDTLEGIIKGSHRSEANKARDHYRHPLETLKFFELEANMKVVEIWPGSGAWYTEILAPYLKDKGQLTLADFSPNVDVPYFKKSREKLRKKLSTDTNRYGAIQFSHFHPPSELNIAPANSQDRILTFRNAHNWYMRGGKDEKLDAAMSSFYKALKPGGLLGIVDHRLPEPASDDLQDHSGYIKTSNIIAAAERAGFSLVAQSEINANKQDTANHPKGVWTLPPSLRLGEENKAHYQGIGESDRMTLKFKK